MDTRSLSLSLIHNCTHIFFLFSALDCIDFLLSLLLLSERLTLDIMFSHVYVPGSMSPSIQFATVLSLSCSSRRYIAYTFHRCSVTDFMCRCFHFAILRFAHYGIIFSTNNSVIHIFTMFFGLGLAL